ncbi:MAG TPA: GNAT family N-acetyltransferase, partial [Acidothermaceae bacterium]
MPDPDVIATTGRVILRPWRVAEADRFFDIYRRPEVTDWLGAPPMVDRQEAVAMIERGIERRAADPRFGGWAVI